MLLGMVAPGGGGGGGGYMVSLFFGLKIGEDQKKGLRRKITGLLVRMKLETK